MPVELPALTFITQSRVAPMHVHVDGSASVGGLWSSGVRASRRRRRRHNNRQPLSTVAELAALPITLNQTARPTATAQAQEYIDAPVAEDLSPSVDLDAPELASEGEDEKAGPVKLERR